MKVLFIGPYRQDDGWGHASRAFLQSLYLTGYDISSAPVYLNQQKEYRKFTDEFILSSENNKNEDYDVVIQNCLPHTFRRYGGVKNVGISFFETTISNTPWVSSIELMDRMWVSSEFEMGILGSANIKDVDVIPIPSDVSKTDEEFEYNKIVKRNEDDFVFYFIGENITRKNLSALVKAFNLEFQPYEQVKLLLKVNNVGRSEEETFEQTKKLINDIKNELGIYKDSYMYKSEYLITRFLSEEDLRGIHKDCDCFVMPSSGEGFCIPAFDALMNHSFIIANENCSISDYVDSVNGHLVKSTLTPAIAPDRPLSFLYNGRDYWYEINVNDLRRSMRSAYEFLNNPLHKEKGTIEVIKEHNRKNVLPNYSFEKISENMKVALGKL